MALDGGVVYDGDLTIWDAGSRTTTGLFSFYQAVGKDWVYQVTVSGLNGGGKQAVFDFEGSLDGINWGHLTVAVKKAGDLNTIDLDGTYMYFSQNQPSRYIRVHLITLTSTSTTTVSVKIGAM
jgi:hypothetical protein